MAMLVQNLTTVVLHRVFDVLFVFAEILEQRIPRLSLVDLSLISILGNVSTKMYTLAKKNEMVNAFIMEKHLSRGLAQPETVSSTVFGVDD